MSEYFSKFKTIQYKGKSVRDISRRTRFPQKYLENSQMFLTYSVTGDDKPEDIAFHYYGSAEYVWLVCISNNIFDQYTDWVLSSDNFDRMMTQKYEKLSGKKGYEVVNWTMNETIASNILYFTKNDFRFSVDTVLIEAVSPLILKNKESPSYNSNVIAAIDTSPYRPVRIYEEEYLLNEAKRDIVLLDSRYLTKAKDDFDKAMLQ